MGGSIKTNYSWCSRALRRRLETFDQILESCLTTENLEIVYSFEKQVEEIGLPASKVIERHRNVRIDLLELVGKLVERKTEKRLKGDELFKVMRRVDQFLKDRNYLIKP